MGNRNRTLWLVAIVVIGLGLMIEAMKTSRGSTTASNRNRGGLFGFVLTEDESSPELGIRNRRGVSHSQAADRARARLRGRLSNDRLAGLVADLDSAPAAAQPMATPGTANLADPLKINSADAAKVAAKKKADLAKKKKKKKKTALSDKQTGIDVTVTEEAEKEGDEFPFGSTSSLGTSNIRTIVPGVVKQQEEASEPETVEDWIAYIMREPSYERTMKLIDAVQQRRLDPSIFHDVIAEMLTDSRGKMQEYAVLALGSYPSLKSFLMLQSINSTVSETSSLKVQSRNFLKNYARIENLRYLLSLISSAGSASASIDSNVLFEALRLIHLSANFYTGSASSSSGSQNPPKPAATPPSVVPSVVRQFNPLLAALNRIAQTSGDSNIRQEAEQALRQVQIITGT